MNPPLFPPPPTTLAAATPTAVGHLGWVLVTATIGLIAIIRILRRPPTTWAHGTWSKIGWILIVIYIAIPLAGYPIPLGAGAALWRTRQPKTTPQPQLPYADDTNQDTK